MLFVARTSEREQDACSLLLRGRPRENDEILCNGIA